MKELKPFDLEAAKRGELIKYNGEVVSYIAGPDYSGLICFEWASGNYGFAHRNEIVMAPKKRTVWINIYNNGYRLESVVFGCEETANLNAGTKAVAIAVPVEIEE